MFGEVETDSTVELQISMDGEVVSTWVDSFQIEHFQMDSGAVVGVDAEPPRDALLDVAALVSFWS